MADLFETASHSLGYALSLPERTIRALVVILGGLIYETLVAGGHR